MSKDYKTTIQEKPGSLGYLGIKKYKNKWEIIENALK